MQLRFLQQESEVLSQRIESLEKENEWLHTRTEGIEAHTRKNNIVLSGLPVTEREDLRMVVKKLAEKMEIKINETDICAIHRLPSRGGAPAKIVTQFNNRDF